MSSFAAGGLLDSMGLWDSEARLFIKEMIAGRAAIQGYFAVRVLRKREEYF
jgi:hypothetical protein